jgi:hypothetical protein
MLAGGYQWSRSSDRTSRPDRQGRLSHSLSHAVLLSLTTAHGIRPTRNTAYSLISRPAGRGLESTEVVEAQMSTDGRQAASKGVRTRGG